MDNEMMKLLKQASENPEYKLLTDYLMARRAMPEMKTGYLGNTTLGEFRTNNALFGGAVSNNGEIVMGHTDGPQALNTLIHELTHAAERQIGEQYLTTRRPPGLFAPVVSTQFTQAYDKLRMNNRYNDVPKSFRSEAGDYRASYSELPAFGMGSTASPNDWNPAPQHVDPTQATEMVTLLKLALQELNAKPQSQGR